MEKLDTLVTMEFKEPAVLFKPDSDVLTDVLKRLETEAKKEVTDAKTEEGRARIWNLAKDVGSSKAFIDKLGKKEQEEAKATVDTINTERKRAKDFLTNLSNEILAPRREWMEKDADRKNGHLKAIKYIDDLPLHFESSEELSNALEQAEAVTVDDSWEEFQSEARDAKAKAITAIKEKLEKALKDEHNARELERFQKEEADRKQKEREEELRKEGEQRAKAEAEKATEELVRRRGWMIPGLGFIDYAEPVTSEQAKREALAIREKFTEDDKDEEAPKTATEVNELNFIERKRQINRTILDHLQVAPLLLSEEQAKELVKAIALGKIPHLSIKY